MRERVQAEEEAQARVLWGGGGGREDGGGRVNEGRRDEARRLAETEQD